MHRLSLSHPFLFSRYVIYIIMSVHSLFNFSLEVLLYTYTISNKKLLVI